MKILKPNFVFIALTSLVILTSCHKDKITPATGITAAPSNIYILNQATAQYGGNTSSYLSYYNIASKTLIADKYGAANGGMQLFGTTGMGVYGSKLYVVGPSGVAVADVKTSKLIKQVNFGYSSHITFYNGDAFVSGDSSIAVIDTVTFAIKKNIPISSEGQYRPGGLAVANNKLYVAIPQQNSNLVFVIDLATLTVTKSIAVIALPVGIAADASGNVYVLSSPLDDDFGTYAGGMTVINSKTDQITFQSQQQVPLCNTFGNNIPIAVCGDFVYYFTASNAIIVFNAKKQTYTGFFVTDGTLFNNPYSITANPATGEIFVGDSKTTNGVIYAFNKTGKLEYTFTTGVLPVQIALVHN